MEFVQFYPTAHGKRGSRILLYEQILTQENAKLMNSRGEDILVINGYSAASITRDELSQVIMKEILKDPEQKSTVDMDLTALSEAAIRSVSMLLPTAWSKGERVFAVAPTTHFCMGGIVTDTDGRTSCPGLYAAGEAAAGAHGANRLGGNALAEVFAMGGVVGRTAAESMESSGSGSVMEEAEKEKHRLTELTDPKGPRPVEQIKALKKTMWYNAGILRNRQSLEAALEALGGWKDVRTSVTTPAELIRSLELANMRLVSEMVCRAALERTESRGAHFRSDYPKEDDGAWRKNIRLRQKGTDVMIEHIPVSEVEALSSSR
jgi:succinate dehydrogenase/fumarate reductase flavoprotein subunit